MARFAQVHEHLEQLREVALATGASGPRVLIMGPLTLVKAFLVSLSSTM